MILIKDQSIDEVPKKSELVADAVRMLRKYSVGGTTTIVAVTDAKVPNKVKVFFFRIS